MQCSRVQGQIIGRCAHVQVLQKEIFFVLLQDAAARSLVCRKQRPTQHHTGRQQAKVAAPAMGLKKLQQQNQRRHAGNPRKHQRLVEGNEHFKRTRRRAQQHLHRDARRQQCCAQIPAEAEENEDLNWPSDSQCGERSAHLHIRHRVLVHGDHCAYAGHGPQRPYRSFRGSADAASGKSAEDGLAQTDIEPRRRRSREPEHRPEHQNPCVDAQAEEETIAQLPRNSRQLVELVDRGERDQSRNRNCLRHIGDEQGYECAVGPFVAANADGKREQRAQRQAAPVPGCG